MQLILTIGKERTFENTLSPLFLGALDAEKIAFIEYNEILPIFSQNDFNWKVTPSNHESKEFKLLGYIIYYKNTRKQMYSPNIPEEELKN